MTHQTRAIFMAFTISLALTLVMSAQGQVQAEDMQKSSQEMKEEGTPTDAGEIQERKVPRMKRSGKATGVAPKTKGVMVQGNRLNAMPGYVLEKGQNNQVSAKRARGGGSAGTATCGCEGGTGECEISAQEGTAICSRSPGTPCNGTCAWDLGITTGVTSPTGKILVR